jgi:hypothetical protein
MVSVTLYQQARVDGGVRSGIEVNGVREWETFQDGGEEFDPALLWFIDVRCKSKNLPKEAEQAKAWLLASAGVIRQGLLDAADHLELGFDSDLRPYEGPEIELPEGGTMCVHVHAIRRLVARDIERELRRMAKGLTKLIKSMEPFVTV